jgi:MFS family permease
MLGMAKKRPKSPQSPWQCSKARMEPPLSDTFAIPIQVPSAEDKVTARSWKALAGSVIGYCMDGFDMLILGFMLATISSDLALTNSQAGSLVTWTLVGAVAGGVLFGSLSDHFGRIRILTYTILIFAVFTFLCAFARGYWDLVVYRVIAGLGLGGEFGIGMALAAEAWPASRRARVSSYVSLGWQSGVLLSALITPILLPMIGWRGMFMVGLLPAFVAFVVRRTLDEPEIFVRKHAVKNENSFRLLVKDRKTFRITLGIALVCAVQNFSYYGIMIWMPSYLGKSLGFSLTKSGLWTSVTVLGMVLGMLTFGQLADRIGRKPVFVLYSVAAFCTVFLYSRVTVATGLLWVGGIMGFSVNHMAGVGALLSEAYPTAARATAQNLLFNLGRAVGAPGPLVVGALAARFSFRAAIALLASVFLLEIIAIVFLVPELKGKALD